ncbi:uncharacterized protein LOC120905063 [Anopheles arabiensis]|uniref:uncharacterized protein LOC120905063 n=1 Tax=Anopheles arabiensis TaxID=7173 RepID=UPI001AAC7605|nr:uncharacterized protein LOC120905063 [Anopheles arabiensis]
MLRVSHWHKFTSHKSAIKSDLLPEILALVDKRALTPILAKPSVSNASRSHTSTNVSSLNATNTSRTTKTASARRTFTNSTELTDDIQAANDTNTVDDSDNCNHYNHRTKPTSDVSAGNYRTNTQASSDPVLNQNTTNTGIAEKVWLYFTNIKSHVSADDMRVWLKAVLPTDDINVYRLTKKGVNLDSMSFISFKVSVPKSLKELALHSTIWPVSLTRVILSPSQMTEILEAIQLEFPPTPPQLSPGVGLQSQSNLSNTNRSPQISPFAKRIAQK